VILMSGFGAQALADRGIEVPCGILIKPFGEEELLSEVRRCLRGRSAA
jgi:hypothetical protein